MLSFSNPGFALPGSSQIVCLNCFSLSQQPVFVHDPAAAAITTPQMTSDIYHGMAASSFQVPAPNSFWSPPEGLTQSPLAQNMPYRVPSAPYVAQSALAQNVLYQPPRRDLYAAQQYSTPQYAVHPSYPAADSRRYSTQTASTTTQAPASSVSSASGTGGGGMTGFRERLVDRANQEGWKTQDFDAFFASYGADV